MKKTIWIIISILFAGLITIQFIGGSMTVLHHEIQTTASVDTVWTILFNLEEVTRYNPTVEQANIIAGSDKNARACILKDGSVVKERIRESNALHSMTMELYESDWPVEDMHWTTELIPTSGGTLIRQTTQYRPKGFMGRIANALVMKRKIDATISDVFAGLKQYAEKK